VRELVGAGFRDVAVFDPDGKDVTEQVGEGLPHSWWLYYVARRSDGRPAGEDESPGGSRGESLP
jgi:hypothetical protein